MNRNKNLKSLSIRLLLFVLFIGYYSSMNLFHHAHLVNGQWMEHSHPFKQTKSHAHSTATFHYIQLLNQAQWEDTALNVHVASPFDFISETLFFYRLTSLYTERHDPIQLRAPPRNC